jgi:hypothetical protein
MRRRFVGQIITRVKIKRRTKIVSEIERGFSFAVIRQPRSFFCRRCDAASEMLSINEAARRLKLRWREIVRRIESGDLHSTETGTGEIYVCAVSSCGGEE